MNSRTKAKAIVVSILSVLTVAALLVALMSREVGHQTAQTIEVRAAGVEDRYADWEAIKDSLDTAETSNKKLGAFFEATTNLRALLTGVMTPTGALERAQYTYAEALVELSGSLSRYSRGEAEWPEIITHVENVQDGRDAFMAEIQTYLGSELLQVWGAVY